MPKTAKRYRLALLTIYHRRYDRVTCRQPNRCFYCGDIASELDHCPSLDIAASLGDGWHRVPHYLIPACKECNARLSDRPLLTPCTRAAYLARRLERDYERFGGLWTKAEIAEMGPSFQQSLRYRQRWMEDIARRVHALQVCAIRGDDWAHEWSDAL